MALATLDIPLLWQFVGRAVRFIKECAGSDGDNTAYVIAPLLLGYQTHWDVYKQERQDMKGELKGAGSNEHIEIQVRTAWDPMGLPRIASSRPV